MCIPKAPKMPSAEEQANQQLKIQRELQADADQEWLEQWTRKGKKPQLHNKDQEGVDEVEAV